MKIALSIMLLGIVTFAGCGQSQSSTSDSRQAAETSARLSEADRQIGMPDITNFQERRLAKDILELRDKELTTHTYIVSLNGDLIYLGQSLGYGLPYSVQFTNPERVAHRQTYQGGSFGTVPQADPNGLFMPGGLSATWVMLMGPDGEVHPIYVEPQIIVSPFKLNPKRAPR